MLYMSTPQDMQMEEFPICIFYTPEVIQSIAGAVLGKIRVKRLARRKLMSDDPNRVWPSGLTLPEALELHKHVIDGSRIFFLIAVFAHILAYAYSPWLK